MPHLRRPHSSESQTRPRFCRLSRLLSVAWFLFANFTGAAEIQHHGLVFERWVSDTFFDGYRPATPTQKWDIPAAANRSHGGIPVNPKAVKFKAPVDLGDALRQFDIDEPFILVLGYWKQEGAEKRFVTLLAPRIEPAAWRKLFGAVTREDIERLDAAIKDRSLTPAQARRAAQQIRSAPPFTTSVITFNPKIDSKTQRRLQCSLGFDDVFRHLAPDADRAPQSRPTLWGAKFPGPIESKPRQFAP